MADNKTNRETGTHFNVVKASQGESPWSTPTTSNAADNRLDEAIDIVARGILRGYRMNWDRTPETFFEVVMSRVEQLAPFPEQAQYQAAYDYLTGRAEGVEL